MLLTLHAEQASNIVGADVAGSEAWFGASGTELLLAGLQGLFGLCWLLPVYCISFALSCVWCAALLCCCFPAPIFACLVQYKACRASYGGVLSVHPVCLPIFFAAMRLACYMCCRRAQDAACEATGVHFPRRHACRYQEIAELAVRWMGAQAGQPAAKKAKAKAAAAQPPAPLLDAMAQELYRVVLFGVFYAQVSLLAFLPYIGAAFSTSPMQILLAFLPYVGAPRSHCTLMTSCWHIISLLGATCALAQVV